MTCDEGPRRIRRALACAALACTALGLAGPAAAQGPEQVATFGIEDAPISILLRGATDLASMTPLLDAFVETFPGLRVDFESWNTSDLYEASAAACRTGGAGRRPADELGR